MTSFDAFAITLSLGVLTTALHLSVASDRSNTFAIDCSKPYISQRNAGRLMGTDNVAETYRKRQSLYANIARHCSGRTGQLMLIARVPRTAADIAELAGR